MSEASLIELERFRGVPVELFSLKPLRPGRLRRLTMPPSFNAATTKTEWVLAAHHVRQVLGASLLQATPLPTGQGLEPTETAGVAV